MKDQILSRKVNIKHLARGMGLDVKKSESESRLSTSRKSIFETLGDEEDELSDGFYFESWLGKRLTIKLENYDRWIASEISLSIEHQLSAVVEFAEWEDYGEHQFRKLKALKNVIKAVQKFVHQGKITENLEENLLWVDVYIDGFEPIYGVPIEVAGARSYELWFAGETEKQRK